MPFNFLNQGQSDETATSFRPIDTFIDPVSKIRVSNPANLIDTDFEYGLQPTKWETVEIINNTPAFFSKSGDTTISDITGITTNGGTREITVTTAFPHNLDVGIPIRVSGTKSLTADGSYIINATPTPTTFTYLSRANQPTTISIFDLYSSIITGEFFQGSQISISDAEGMTTDGVGPNSTITIKTANKHGFGPKTPFYFLNLNSTVSQEFESTNNTSLSFDPTNSATAQNFDGSNTLLQTPIDLSNSATTSIHENAVTSTDVNNQTFTVNIVQEDAANWANLKYGDPLYYSLSIGSGYFQANPRGVVFIKGVNEIDATSTLTATFQVTAIPDGDPIPVLANTTGYFQIADQSRTFAGNNVDEQSQIEIPIIVGETFEFDGSNQGYIGTPLEPIDNTSTVVGYTGTTMTVFTAEGFLDYYVGAMLRYSTDGDAATGLVNGRTYFVTFFEPGASSGLYTMSIAELPGEADISVSGGTGTQIFEKIGVSIDKDIVHVPNSNFQENDMIEYSAPVNASFVYDTEEAPKRFFYVATAYDEHNYELNEGIGFRSVVATGGNVITGRYIDTSVSAAPGMMTSIGANAQLYTIHMFTSPGTHTFTVESIGIEGLNTIEYLVVGGGGGGGNDMGGGGGGGGVLSGSFIPTEPASYTIEVGDGGLSNGNGYRSSEPRGDSGQPSSAFGLTALGGGGGGGGHRSDNQVSRAGRSGSSGGGAPGRGNRGPGSGTSGQGFRGGNSGGQWYAGAGGGAGSQATDGGNSSPGNGIMNDIMGIPYYWGGGGAKGGYSNYSTKGGLGGGGGGGHFGYQDAGGINPSGTGVFGNCCGDKIGGSGGVNTGGGAGGHAHQGSSNARKGGSGIVIVRYLGAPQSQDNFIAATGGTESTITEGSITYRVHSFTNVGSSNLEVLDTSDDPNYNYFEYLVVGGGGGGGNDMGGGGGGGGVLTGYIGLEVGTYTITVGDGGSSNGNGYRSSVPQGFRGQDSSAFGITALGGGGGGGGHRSDNQTSLPGEQGASGGGSPGRGNAPSGRGVPGQGNRGGNSGGSWYAGSGGGAGSRATDGTGSLPGDGIQTSILGTSYYFGGGGGKGGYSNAGARGGIGGGGGGGNGGAGDTNGINPGENGTGGSTNGIGGSGGANTGGGAGGHSHQGSNGSKKGGSGIVVVRYPIGVA